jgi:hypothetical protein
VPANAKLDAAFDALEDADHDRLTAAQHDLQSIAATERDFDRQLSALGLPPAMSSIANALVAVNEQRASLTDQAAAAPTLAQLHTFDDRLEAANDPVEDQVRALRSQLGLPPPDTD